MVAGSTLLAVTAAAIIGSVAAAGQPAGYSRLAHPAATSGAASPALAHEVARFEAAARFDAVKIGIARARHAELLAARRRAARRKAARQAMAPAPPAAATAASGSPRQIAMAMLGSFGWSSAQFSCLDALWSRESGWNPYASNTASGAYGIPQALPGSKMASAGPDWQSNPATQIRWGLGYIKATYGSPCNAWAHEQSYGSY